MLIPKKNVPPTFMKVHRALAVGEGYDKLSTADLLAYFAVQSAYSSVSRTVSDGYLCRDNIAYTTHLATDRLLDLLQPKKDDVVAIMDDDAVAIMDDDYEGYWDDDEFDDDDWGGDDDEEED